MAGWAKRQVCGVLLDITGVLYDSGPEGGTAISGSVEAVKRLKASSLPVRFCTNETQCTKRMLVDKLQHLGFTMSENEVFPPAPAMCHILKQRNLRPHLLVHPDALPDFSACDRSNPNCVVIGDAADEFSYKNVNDVFRLLVSLDKPVLFSLGKGKYYKENNKLCLDVGPYMKALEYACDLEAEVVGKPSAAFFEAAVQDMGVEPGQVVMVGDDVVNDVGGAQACGIRGVLVRTGKYRPQDEKHPTVNPDGIVDDLAQAIDSLLEGR
ncbi:phospholysine phosphohistidine inorganic pyrophosphate phosphatase-like [Gigantopelta aegis]|uniref:phospholysine phosphohistidine inorganic pyrophosphate phosphatase-like n=1 Tax=Gigantopelta aegis TaxID=1735272 RepID=UPI001B88A836|nr:phospholysine phosphohistidine inorganic pyrophosphate phosphatase-like [Gigantopelta aegis]